MAKNATPRQPNILPVLLTGIATIGIGSTFYHHVENLKWLDSVYFSVVTLTTIGYGDIVPKTDAGKIFTIFYVIVGIGILAGVANYLLQHAFNRRLMNKHHNQEKNKNNLSN